MKKEDASKALSNAKPEGTPAPAAKSATPAMSAAPAATEAAPAKITNEIAVVETNLGTIKIKFYPDVAPKAVENWVGLAKKGYYNGVTFHRVIDGFMIQGGDPLGQGIGGPGYKFADEFHPKLRHDKAGILSMANSGPNTNGGQFFITLGATPHLDNRHSVFGEVTSGMDIVRRIGSTPTGRQDRPVKDITILGIKITRD